MAYQLTWNLQYFIVKNNLASVWVEVFKTPGGQILIPIVVEVIGSKYHNILYL